jgi:CHAT domain-containing protein
MQLDTTVIVNRPLALSSIASFPRIYTSSIKMLKYSRADSTLRTKQEVRIFAMPNTPNQANLNLASDEAWIVEQFMTQSPLSNNVVRKDEGVTTADLHKLLPDATIAHFACHAVLDKENPSSSRLLFKDGCVKVSEIAQYNLRKGALAYLSACSTAITGGSNGFWDDEAITLTSAFQVAGFSHIVGTLWSAEDYTSYQVAKSFYESLENDSSRSALALHKTILQQREENLLQPSLWAPYIHQGA